MEMQLRTISEQVMVVTGASSGIGLVTAKLAARRGACVVLASRNAADLDAAVAEIESAGGRAIRVVADVASLDDVQRVADATIDAFGRVDSWVNGAGVSIYGKVMDVPVADMRRLMDVDYWGVVHGCVVAVPLLRRGGGAIINMGSALSERAVPLQGAYAAAKHAVKAYTDTLRMELESEGAPISVTLVKPASMDTPFFQKARSYMGVVPRPFPPVYAPDLVAEAIIECAQHPMRDVYVGGAAKAIAALEDMSPRLADVVLERTGFDSQRSDLPDDGRRDNLYEPARDDGGERGSSYGGPVLEHSAYTAASMHPRATLLGAAGLGLVVAAGLRARRRSADRPRERELPSPTVQA